MPQHREPMWLNLFFDHYISPAAEYLDWLFRGTSLEYWLLNPEGQIGTLFMTLILAALIWLIVLSYSFRRNDQRAASSMLAQAERNDIQQIQDVHEHVAPSVAQPNHVVQTLSPDEIQFVREIAPQGRVPPNTPTPAFMRKLAPPGHIPTNADLESSPFHLARPLGNADRMGRVSTPGYQTPFAVPTHSPNFSDLKEKAPENWKTLQEMGMLHPDGTPTKKGEKFKQMSDAQASGVKSQGKKVVAYWTNDTGSKGGRARMRRELDEAPGL